MPSEDPAEFPDVPTFAEEKYHEMTAGALREMIRRTIFAAADGEQPRFAHDRRPVGAGGRPGPPGRDRRPAAGAGRGAGDGRTAATRPRARRRSCRPRR